MTEIFEVGSGNAEVGKKENDEIWIMEIRTLVGLLFLK
jgi:hypothetical protein